MDRWLENLAPYFAALRGESDRGVIILSAAFIDDLLVGGDVD